MNAYIAFPVGVGGPLAVDEAKKLTNKVCFTSSVVRDFRKRKYIRFASAPDTFPKGKAIKH